MKESGAVGMKHIREDFQMILRNINQIKIEYHITPYQLLLNSFQLPISIFVDSKSKPPNLFPIMLRYFSLKIFYNPLSDDAVMKLAGVSRLEFANKVRN